MTQYFTSSDGLRLAYDDAGEGLPLICLAGLTRAASDFDFLAPHLSGVRLIRPDYRGRGRSDWGPPESYILPVEARDVMELMNHLGLERAAILGTSRGGLLAMLMASTVKHRLIGVCLNDIGPELAPGGLALIRDYVGKQPAVKNHELAARARARMMTGFTGVPHARWLEEVRRHLVPDDAGRLRLNYDPALARTVNTPALAPVNMWPMFEALAGLPLAALRGETSDLLTRATFRRMRLRRPDMIAAEVPGRGHVPFLDEPEALAVITEWIDQCR